MPRRLRLWTRWNKQRVHMRGEERRLSCLEGSDSGNDGINEESEGEKRSSRRQDWREIQNSIKETIFQKSIKG